MAKKVKQKKASISLDLNINLPTCWGDLTADQVQRLSYYFSRGLERTETLVRLALDFGGLKPHGVAVSPDGSLNHVYYHRTEGNIVLNTEQIALLSAFLEWVFSPVELMATPPIDGCKSPDNRLYGVTLEQFITADSACSAYVRSKEVKPLAVMVASLYPRSGVFNSETLSTEADRLFYLPRWQMDAVVLWFSGAKKWLADKYPYVFSGGDDGGVSSGSDVLLGLLSSLNDGRVVDNDAIKKSEIHEAMYELNQKIKISQQLKNK